MARHEDVTYEVLLLLSDRWEAQGVYQANEQMLAISDAKSLARVSTVKGVKVVKEFYDPKIGTSRTLTVFEHKPNQGSAARPGGGQGARGSGSPGESVTEPEQPKKTGSILGVIVKILLSLVFSLVAAMAVTQVSSMALKDMRSIGMFSKSDFLNLVFMMSFVITALALVTKILVNMKRLDAILPMGKPSKPKRVRNERLTPSAGKSNAREKDKDEPPSEMDLMKADLAEKSKEAEEAENGPLSEIEKMKAEVAAKEEEEAKKAEEEARKKAEAEVAAAKKAESDALSEIITMKAFTDDAFDVLKGDGDKQDAHTVFGLVLFLVGAVQTMAQQRKLPETLAATVMNKTLGSLGLSPERIRHFNSSIDDYLISNPRYSQMFQAGRGAMTVYLDSDIGPRGALSDSLEEWTKPKSSTVKANQPVTVLFTDIAGSTAMTQKLGDAGAQDVVRIHNTIVRSAIKAFSGREVKHTGDGIMASFPSAAQGVEAAIDMQKQTQAHNAKDDKRPLGLKIGLNAGEPISEEDDLYGTTVQLAARIVDKAQAGEILVSSSVHGLSQGKNLKFIRAADYDMKGFDEAVTVYFAQWDGNAPPQPKAKAEAKPEEAKPEAKPGAKAEVKVEPKAGSKSEPKPEPKPTANSEPITQTKVKPEVKPAVAPSIVAKASEPMAKPAAAKPVAKPTPAKTDKAEPRVTKDPDPSS